MSWLGFAGIALGVVIGIWLKPVATILGYAGDIFTRLIDLCVLPMLVTLIATSIAKLRDSRVGRHLGRPLALVLVVGSLSAAVVPMLFGFVLDLGTRLSPEALAALGTYVHASSAGLSIPLGAVAIATEPRSPLYALFLSFIPGNVFAAFESSIRSQLLVVAIIFGAGLAASSQHARRSVVDILDLIYAGFRGVFRWLLLVLPLGLACKISAEVAEVSPAAFSGMWPFALLSVAMFLGLIALAVAILVHRSRANAGRIVRTMFRPMIVAFAANDAGAGAPSATEGMRSLGYPPISSDAMTPLTISIGKVAGIAYAAFAIAFAISIYHVHLDPAAILALMLGSIAAGIAAPPEGTSGVVLIGSTMELAGLPTDAMIVLLGVVDPIVKPFRAAANVATGMLLAACVMPRKRRMTLARIGAVKSA